MAVTGTFSSPDLPPQQNDGLDILLKESLYADILQYCSWEQIMPWKN